MTKFDLSKIKKDLATAGISTQLSQPDKFISTGNYALNYIISGNFRVSIPNRRLTMFCGPPGAGKSLLAWNLAKVAQDAGYFVFGIDTENAMDKAYLDKIQLKQDDAHFTPLAVSSIEKCAEAFSTIFRNTSPADKICVVVDSLGNLDTLDSVEQFDKKGTLKNDMGLKSKKIKQLIKDINIQSGSRDMFIIVCNHVYQNQDMLNGQGKYIVSGGPSVQYIPSITILVDKKKLKDQEDKSAQVLGIRVAAEVIKTRFFRHAGKTEFEVPYDTGINPLSGFVACALDAGILQQSGAWYTFTDTAGTPHKFYEKNLAEHIEPLLAMFDGLIIEHEEEATATEETNSDE